MYRREAVCAISDCKARTPPGRTIGESVRRFGHCRCVGLLRRWHSLLQRCDLLPQSCIGLQRGLRQPQHVRRPSVCIENLLQIPGRVLPPDNLFVLGGRRAPQALEPLLPRASTRVSIAVTAQMHSSAVKDVVSQSTLACIASGNRSSCHEHDVSIVEAPGMPIFRLHYAVAWR